MTLFCLIKCTSSLKNSIFVLVDGLLKHPDDDRMIDVNWAYIERPWLFDPILERQLEYELGL